MAPPIGSCLACMSPWVRSSVLHKPGMMVYLVTALEIEARQSEVMGHLPLNSEFKATYDSVSKKKTEKRRLVSPLCLVGGMNFQGDRVRPAFKRRAY